MKSHVSGRITREMEMGSQETSALLKRDEDPTFSKKRKGDHKLAILVLASLLICFVIITILLAVLLGVRVADEEDSTKCGSTCTTSMCLEATSFLIQGLDQSVNPCEDFYKYSCGNWEANNVIPEGFGRYSTFNELGTSNSITLKKALEEPVPEGDDGSVSKARYMYTQCMDLNAINERGADPLREIVRENGGWELIGMEETEPNWTLEDSLYREHYYGSDAIFSFSIEPDDFNSSKVVIKVLCLSVFVLCEYVCVHTCVSVCLSSCVCAYMCVCVRVFVVQYDA